MSGAIKFCMKCGTTKALDDFYNSKHTSDLHSASCKACTNKASKESRKKHYMPVSKMNPVQKAAWDAYKATLKVDENGKTISKTEARPAV